MPPKKKGKKGNIIIKKKISYLQNLTFLQMEMMIMKIK